MLWFQCLSDGFKRFNYNFHGIGQLGGGFGHELIDEGHAPECKFRLFAHGQITDYGFLIRCPVFTGTHPSARRQGIITGPAVSGQHDPFNIHIPDILDLAPDIYNIGVGTVLSKEKLLFGDDYFSFRRFGASQKAQTDNQHDQKKGTVSSIHCMPPPLVLKSGLNANDPCKSVFFLLMI
jgi:hypothetical protein